MKQCNANRDSLKNIRMRIIVVSFFMLLCLGYAYSNFIDGNRGWALFMYILACINFLSVKNNFWHLLDYRKKIREQNNPKESLDTPNTNKSERKK